MTISVGNRLPDADFLRVGENGLETVALADRLKGRKVVLFAVPGAFTGNCTAVHVPGFIRAGQALKDKGVEEIICLAVNDPFVLNAWGESTGGHAAGITFLADPAGAFAKAIGKTFDHEPGGMFNRSVRYSALIEDGVVTKLFEDAPGACQFAVAEEMLDAL